MRAAGTPHNTGQAGAVQVTGVIPAVAFTVPVTAMLTIMLTIMLTTVPVLVTDPVTWFQLHDYGYTAVWVLRWQYYVTVMGTVIAIVVVVVIVIGMITIIGIVTDAEMVIIIYL